MNLTAIPQSDVQKRSGIFNQLFRFHSTLVASLAVLVALFCASSVNDPDIWWHMENARRFVASGHFARQDVFSFTALGSPWMNHEWLAELPFYFAYRAFGAQGLYGMSLLLAEAILIGTFYLGYKESDNFKDAFLYGCLGILLSVVNFGPRTILFGWCCLMIVLRILQRIRNGQKGPWWCIPLVFCVWVNTHGSWLIGLIVCAILVFPGFFPMEFEWVEHREWNRTQKKQLLSAAALSLVAMFCNPYGYRLVLYPFDLAFRQKLNVGHVEEWMSVDFHNARGKIAFLMLMVVFASFALSRLRPRVEELLLTAFALYASLTHIRFLLLASILLAPIVVRRMDFMTPYDESIDKPKLNAVIVAAIVLTVFLRFPSEATLRAKMSKNYPDQALAYLKQHAPQSRVFNDYAWGGYMIWTTPELPTFIDSRTDIFEYNGTLGDYLKITSIDNSLALLDQQRIQYVLMRSDAPLVYLLEHAGPWHKVMGDEVGVLFERAQNSNAMQSPN